MRWLVAVLFVGCSTPTGGAGSAAPERTASAPTLVSAAPPPSATTIPVVAFDASPFCKKLCDRSAECGVSEAEALARRSGDKEEMAAVAKERGAVGDVARVCTDGCMKTPPTAEEAHSTDSCMAEKECAAFTKCIAALH